jgi:hypothetical protein
MTSFMNDFALTYVDSLRQCASFPSERLDPFLEQFKAWKNAFDEKKKARASDSAYVKDSEDSSGNVQEAYQDDPTNPIKQVGFQGMKWENKGRGGGNSQRKSNWWKRHKGA